ncbi:nickel-dependent hydrogenase large subunit [Corynebacterium breve]|uniref:Nickel-dependent hydrogenase large subunit n=1 Tax=Corynebacterium breve TaxID=3049799 RepID=A0ABY8VF72_9CORY|nr:nickel-dependent hydrogenase large subunit [Corynebacterium breve]WIM68280.1 nickel-dependent hydrogenase large subunit [Corynebacterium breve]
MARIKLPIDAVVDPLAVSVIVEGDAARFDVAGVPRVDPHLVGRPAHTVPTLVTRLCGLCPVTHHLAGMRALDHLVDQPVDDTARAVRALLHHGSVFDVMGPRLAPTHALELKRFGKAVLSAAGCPGHFPDVAVPGGVRAAADPDLVATLVDELPRIQTIVDKLQGDPWQPPTTPLDVWVSNGDKWDPLGDFLQAEELIPISEIPQRIRETRPGEINPHPQIIVDGTWHDYRVGPASRHPEMSPAQAQIATLHDSLYALRTLLDDPALTTPVTAPDLPLRDGTGVGVVDGPRGLLIHEYEVRESIVTRARILSPTAQNEPWLAEMLTHVIAHGGDARAVEEPIRAADPCLPCTNAPRGMMNVTIKEK